MPMHGLLIPDLKAEPGRLFIAPAGHFPGGSEEIWSADLSAFWILLVFHLLQLVRLRLQLFLPYRRYYLL